MVRNIVIFCIIAGLGVTLIAVLANWNQIPGAPDIPAFGGTSKPDIIMVNDVSPSYAISNAESRGLLAGWAPGDYIDVSVGGGSAYMFRRIVDLDGFIASFPEGALAEMPGKILYGNTWNDRTYGVAFIHDGVWWMAPILDVSYIPIADMLDFIQAQYF